MKTTLVKDCSYNGISCVVSRKYINIPCEILGVMVPPDPGMVYIQLESGKKKQVPVFLLKNCPDIDFEQLLTQDQIDLRRIHGFLYGNGSFPTKLKPLEECPLCLTS